MKLLTKYLFWAAVLVLVCKQSCVAQPTTLWTIGTSDKNTEEFAHAPGGYRDYRQPGLFVVGTSDPKRDWPYVHPGPVDAWAGSIPHTFTILFGLHKPSQNGNYRLVVDLVDTQFRYPPKLRVTCNGHLVGEHDTPAGISDQSIEGSPEQGCSHHFALDVASDILINGTNRIEITTTSGCWILYDAVRLEAPAEARSVPVPDGCLLRSVTPRSCLVERTGHLFHPVVLDIVRIGSTLTVQSKANDSELDAIELQPGSQEITVYIPAVREATPVHIALESDERTLVETDITLQPVRNWEIHLIHQTHLDIGYTHHQDEVLAKQVEYLRQAMDYIDQTKDYPEEAQFVWHPEGMWAVDEFMRIAPDEKKERFVEACRQRQIHLDVLYAQAMTGMFTEEELFELMAAAKRFEAEWGVTIDSAMQSDVPGYTWGLVSALAHHGVKYISIGPNHFHRMGYTFEWGDKPFWWEDPSGEHHVLFWMCGDGYAYFHNHRLDENSVFDYLTSLERKGYPYEMSLMRYCIGGDNGPPRRELCDFVRDWNEKYVTPKLVIARNSDALNEFAKRYGDELPIIRGDFTPYWEDGSASTALATGVNRRACEQIAQVQKLWAMLRPDLDLHEDFDRAWNKMIMYDEHTWGAHNSISQPDHAFAIQQDLYKQQFAHDGAAMTQRLLEKVSVAHQVGSTDTFAVYNTASWMRDGLVVLSAEQSTIGDRVVDGEDRVIPSQRLESGGLAFVARDVPPLGAREYTVEQGKALLSGNAHAEGLTISNNQLSLLINKVTGAISSMRYKPVNHELVDQMLDEGLNDYLYIIGRDPTKNRMTIKNGISVFVEDVGPLVATLRIESEAPGCRKLIRRVRVVDGLDHVSLLNTTDKLKERRPEGLYFSFPFDVPEAEARIDVPWTVVQVEKDQMVGANRNYYCVQRFVDLSNDDFGVTWSPIDAPMVQFDPIIIASAQGRKTWRTFIDPKSFLHSWTMNNHWETNFKADQEGIINFAYAIRPHEGGYDAVSAQRFGRDACQPLMVIPVDTGQPSYEAPFKLIGDDGIIITSLRPSRDGQAMMVRLFNVSDQPQSFSLRWSRPVGRSWISNPMENALQACPESVELDRFEIMTIRIDNLD